MSATSITSLKSAITTRVNPANAERSFHEARALGNPKICPRSAYFPNVDEWGRPVGNSVHRTLLVADAACSNYVYPLTRKLKHENAERPILGPCNPGDRGAGDFLYGSARDRFPKNLYGEGSRGNFSSPFVGFKQADGVPKMSKYNVAFEPATARPPSLSHDDLVMPYFG